MPAPTAPSPPPPAAAAQRRRVTREDLIQFGQAGKPWEFLPLVVQALDALPQDDALRFLAASGFASLGLTTPAREHIARLAEATRSQPGVRALEEAMLAMPTDGVPNARRIATCRANVESLRARGIDLGEQVSQWSERISGEEWLRASDANVVRRRAADGVWRRLRDDVGEAEGVQFPHRRGAGASEADAPMAYVIEGLDPPWLFKRLWNATPRASDGYQPLIHVVQADPVELLDGLSLVDLRKELADPRVRFFIGADATESLTADLRSRFDQAIRGVVLTTGGMRARATPTSGAAVERCVEEQAAEHARLRIEAARQYEGRDAAWWAERFRSALTRAGAPLRILVPTCRYSTFVKHSSEDLIAAIRESGHEAQLLIEPDDSTRLSSIAYLRAIVEFRPDLVMLINYMRAHLGESMPKNVPFVCWIQDAMGHLFDEKIGVGQTGLDFVAGNVYPALIERFKYPGARALRSPIVASAQKFHATPVSADLRRKFECEVAYLSHQSEPPGALLERLLERCKNSPPVRTAVEAMAPRIAELAGDPMRGPIHAGLSEIVRGALAASLGREPDERLTTLVINQTCLPLADRILRHQTIEWAAEISERRGWRMRLYGRDWEKHPRLGAHACGETAHGEELRACYQSAAAHLHVTINALVHQRVAECALSGGLPLCRMHYDEMHSFTTWAQSRARSRGPVEWQSIPERWEGFRVADHPELMRLARERQLRDEPTYGVEWINDAMRRIIESGIADGQEQIAALVLGEASQATFRDRDELEAALDGAVERPAWRRSASSMIASRSKQWLTHDVFVRRLLEFVRDGLAPKGGRPAPRRGLEDS